MDRVLNIGSVNIDYVYRVHHFVQPGETLASLHREVFPGGKGLNQSIALARAGAGVYHAGRIGPDGADMAQAMREAGVDIRYLDQNADTTGHTIIQVDEAGQNCILYFAGANGELSEGYIDSVLTHFDENDVLLLQNEVSCVPYAMQKARQKGMRIAFNPSPIGPEIASYPLEAVTWLIVNEVEGQALSGEGEQETMLAALRKKYPATAIVLTLGQDGVLYDDGKEHLRHGIYEVPVVDTTAAGDAFTGYFLARLLAGGTPAEALHLASAAASITVSTAGASPSIPVLAQVLGKAGA